MQNQHVNTNGGPGNLEVAISARSAKPREYSPSPLGAACVVVNTVLGLPILALAFVIVCLYNLVRGIREWYLEAAE